MKKLLFLAVLAVAILAAACSKYKYESVSGDPLKTRIYTLDNGLKVYLSVNKETPRLQTAIAVKVGGKNDPAESTGLAHYFEHLMFKGTQQFGTSDYAAEQPMLDRIEQLFEEYRKTADTAMRRAIYHTIDSISYEASKIAIPSEYDKLMAAIGASGTNAFTSQDMTVYVEDIPSNQIDNWAKIQSDRFEHPVIRGFHTELETIYEEKNMSLTRDGNKLYEAMDAALFPNHPYGTQTVLGTQESLKNPSITNVKNYHKTYYVPNNMAVCIAGDFDPDEMIAIVDKYFGGMQPNKELPKLEFTPEQPITAPVVKEVFGLEAENVAMGWRLPTAIDPSNDVADIATSILHNGQAGLMDLDLNQQQKVLSSFCYLNAQPDYSSVFVGASPKAGQSLDEVRDLVLSEVAKLRNGEFDETLIQATINNYKSNQMRRYEDNYGRVDLFINSFINGSKWADDIKQLDRMSKLTKQDIVDWANKYMGADNYAIVYKRQGKDPNEQKIAAPKITPIVTNRDSSSAFLDSVKTSQVKPIEPVFVDYQKDMSQFEQQPMVNVLYKKNETNDIFSLTYVFNTGTENDPALNLAFSYLKYLGTDEMTAEKIASEMYNIACDFGMSAGNNQCSIYINGLGENMGKAIDIVDKLILNAKPNEAILANLKADQLKKRSDAKAHQQRCFSTLQRYLFLGGDAIHRTTLTNPALEGLTSADLLQKVRDLMGKQHEILYYGPQGDKELKSALAEHHKLAADLQPLEKKYTNYVRTDENKVVVAPYDAKQLYYLQFSNRGEKFDPTATPSISLYNDYFGGGMNSVVFQEMREARGLAYTAWATISTPYYKDGEYMYYAFIATQNDKMQTAIKAFDEIINNMPESEAAFTIAKEGLISRLRTERTVKENVLWSYLSDREKGLIEDSNKQIFEKAQTMTLADIKAAQEKWVKGRKYVYGILGDEKDIDMTYLKTLGPVEVISQEEMFGY